MNVSPKDHRLFHYTPQLAFLQDMLRNGIWPRFCAEDFDWLLGHSIFIAFPVVCFCDIPVPAATHHRQRYGDFAIAFNKTNATSMDVNPVWYVQERTSIADYLSANCRHRVRTTLETIPEPLKRLLPFMKSTIGAQPDRCNTLTQTLEVLAFEEELEWRYTPKKLVGDWKFGYSRDIVTDTDHQKSASYRIPVQLGDIETIYVPAKSDRDVIAKEFDVLAARIELWSN